MPERITALESRLTDLTEDVRASRQDAAAARVLAGGADRDVQQNRAEIRDFRQATTLTLNALRETQLDHGQQLRAQSALPTELNDKVDQGFLEVRAKFDQMAGGMQHITGLLTNIISTEDGQ